MLTCPSDSLPHIVCPMDGGALPPNPFCSAPLHSQPQSPPPSLSSITPRRWAPQGTQGEKMSVLKLRNNFRNVIHSREDDGHSGKRRSGRIKLQSPRKRSSEGGGGAERPSAQDPSAAKRERESGTDVFDSNDASDRPTKYRGLKIARSKGNLLATENVEDQFEDNTAKDFGSHSKTPNLDMEVSCGGLALETPSAPAGWVIGPFIQSFKSKMASFTEIVMSPVKLFKANPHSTEGDCDLHITAASREEPSGTVQGCLDNGHEGSTDRTKDYYLPNDNFICKQGDPNHKLTSSLALGVEEKFNPATAAPLQSQKVPSDVDLLARNLPQAIDQLTNQSASTSMEMDTHESLPLQRIFLPHTLEKDSKSSPSFPQSTALGLQLPDKAKALSRSQSELSVEKGKQGANEAARSNPLHTKGTCNKLARQSSSSSLLPCNVMLEDFALKPRGKQLFQIAETTIGDLSNNGRLQSLASSVCYTSPDQLCPPHYNSRKSGTRNLFIQKSPPKALEAVSAVDDTLNAAEETEPYGKHGGGQDAGPNFVDDPAVKVGKEKRRLKLDAPTETEKALVKTKRLESNKRKVVAKSEVAAVVSDRVNAGALNWPRKNVTTTNTIADTGRMLNSAAPKGPIAKRMRRQGEGIPQSLSTINTSTQSKETGNPSDGALTVSSLDPKNTASENGSKESGCRRNTGASANCLTTKPYFKAADRMDLETTTTLIKEARMEQKPKVLIQPLDVKLCRPKGGRRKRDTSDDSENLRARQSVNGKLLKRKIRAQEPSGAKRGSAVDPAPSAVFTLELIPTDLNTSGPVHRAKVVQPFRKAKRNSGAAVVQPPPEYSTHLDEHNMKHVKTSLGRSGRQRTVCSLVGGGGREAVDAGQNRSEAGVGAGCGSAQSQTHGVDTRGDQPGVCIRKVEHKSAMADCLKACQEKVDEGKMRASLKEEVDVAAYARETCGSQRFLLRSVSCPEIPSLVPHDTPCTPPLYSPQHGRCHMSHHSHSPISVPPPPPHARCAPRRARRHTVSSVEVEREIAPLCLRKEVYPTRSPAAQPRSPSLTALATCFLSSSLAFLCKRMEGRGSSASTHCPVPSPSSSVSPRRPFSGFPSVSSISSARSLLSQVPLECASEMRHQSEEEDVEDPNYCSQAFDVALREEKALSDSEIKVVTKLEPRGKVSSIRIRKTLPKPQNNLTPMGLPKPIRLKKKDFSLEEIYTNKNFTKPPESRLETIFEMPLSRRNGSQAVFGQRRLKRFVEFPEVGVSRKPKKPLKGPAAAPGRPRRGGGGGSSQSSREEPSVSELDALLCAKLDQLNLFLTVDQRDS